MRERTNPFMRCVLSAIFVGTLAGCAPTPPLAPEKPASTKPKPKTSIDLAKVKDAKTIKTKRFTIYYLGTAEGEYTADHADWHGTVKGFVQLRYVGEGRELSGKNITLTLSPNGGIKVDGQNTITFSLP